MAVPFAAMLRRDSSSRCPSSAWDPTRPKAPLRPPFTATKSSPLVSCVPFSGPPLDQPLPALISLDCLCTSTPQGRAAHSLRPFLTVPSSSLGPHSAPKLRFALRFTAPVIPHLVFPCTSGEPSLDHPLPALISLDHLCNRLSETLLSTFPKPPLCTSTQPRAETFTRFDLL
jgi:hypothetical protein